MTKLTLEQQTVLDDVKSLIKKSGHPVPYFQYPFITTIGGYAGTGKTFLLCEIRKEIKKLFPSVQVAFVSFTGKASYVLRNKLKDTKTLLPTDHVGTIHSLLYKPVVKWNKVLKTFVITDWERKNPEEINHQIFIIDEASMVSKELWNDLKSCGRPIIAVGDHGQLPPIGEAFNLMKNPDFKLTQIHRQALDSPIISLSQFVRKEGFIPFNRFFSNEVFKLSWNHPMTKKIWEEKLIFDKDLIVLCGFNTTRAYINDMIRKKNSFKNKEPYPGERIVCLVNDHNKKIMNGQIGTVLWVMPDDYSLYRVTVEMDDEIYECMINTQSFGQVQYTMFDKDELKKKQAKYSSKMGLYGVNYFDYGYCISVHKSQGSEWDKVVLFEQRSKHWDDDYWARWLYTAITRAKEKLFVISDFYG